MSTDEAEGIIRQHGNLIFYDPSSIADMSIDSTVRVEGEGDAQVRHFTNDVVRSKNVYTFCASSTYSEAQHEAWNRSEGYDACYRINSAKLFFRAITRELADADFLFFAAAEYMREAETNHEIHGRFHPALLKRAGGYDDQHEIRALWRPKNTAKEITPLVIPTSRAGCYCESYRVI